MPTFLMSVKQIYIHAGLPKVGSSSIQMTLASNRGTLRRQGYYFPIGPDRDRNHSKLFRKAFNQGQGNTSALQALNAILKEADSLSCHTLLFSGEGIYGNLDAEGIRKATSFIKTELPSAKISVLLYLRHPYTWICSYIQHLLKWGDKKLYSLYNKQPRISLIHNIKKFLQPNLPIRLQLYTLEQCGSLQTHLMDAIGLSQKNLESIQYPEPIRNSLSFRSILVLDALKNLAIELTHPRREFLEHLPTDDTPFTLPRSLLESHREYLLHELDWLHQECGIHYDPEDFPVFPSELPKLREPDLNPLLEWISKTHDTQVNPLQVNNDICDQFEQLKNL
jgi:hypothetical protein